MPRTSSSSAPLSICLALDREICKDSHHHCGARLHVLGLLDQTKEQQLAKKPANAHDGAADPLADFEDIFSTNDNRTGPDLPGHADNTVALRAACAELEDTVLLKTRRRLKKGKDRTRIPKPVLVGPDGAVVPGGAAFPGMAAVAPGTGAFPLGRKATADDIFGYLNQNVLGGNPSHYVGEGKTRVVWGDSNADNGGVAIVKWGERDRREFARRMAYRWCDAEAAELEHAKPFDRSLVKNLVIQLRQYSAGNLVAALGVGNAIAADYGRTGAMSTPGGLGDLGIAGFRGMCQEFYPFPILSLLHHARG